MSRARRPRFRSTAVALAAALLACEAPEQLVYRAPAQARAAWLLEPPVLAVGEVARLDLAVVTAPAETLRPFELPDRLDGFFVLEREPVQVVKEPARWVHHTRLRVRAIEVGRFEVPGGSIELEDAEGVAALLHYDALALEVVSVLGEAGRQSPYGIRLLARTRDGGNTLGAFGAGAVLSLASVGVWLLVRRRLAQRPAEPAPVATPAWEIARSELLGARAAAAQDPQRALDLASLALRRFAALRFGGDANVRTTQELAASDPPFLLTTRWPRFLELLAAFDAARFPAPDPGAAPGALAARAAALIGDAEAFVADSSPLESRA